MPESRHWMQFEATVINVGPVVKIVFERAAARLYIVAGEALLITAWTTQRREIAALKEYASLAGAWTECRPDAADETTIEERVRLDAIDKIVWIETAGGVALDLYAAGAFLGQVEGSDASHGLERQLGVGK